MIHHGGLLDVDPTQNSLWNWARSCQLAQMPDDVATPLRVWFLTPGVPDNFHATAFNLDIRRVVKHLRDAEQHIDELLPLVTENWLSVQRPDAVKLSQYRGRGDFPLLVKLQIVADVKAGQNQYEIAEEYGTSQTFVSLLAKFGPFWHVRNLPSWFKPLG